MGVVVFGLRTCKYIGKITEDWLLHPWICFLCLPITEIEKEREREAVVGVEECMSILHYSLPFSGSLFLPLYLYKPPSNFMFLRLSSVYPSTVNLCVLIKLICIKYLQSTVYFAKCSFIQQVHKCLSLSAQTTPPHHSSILLNSSGCFDKTFTFPKLVAAVCLIVTFRGKLHLLYKK